MESGIYRLFWDSCDYYYYGQAKDIKKRISIHISNLRKNKHANKKIQSIYKKYGFPNYEVVEFCELDVIDDREQYYISKFFNEKECCNICPDARTVRGVKRSDEMKKRLSLAKIGIPSPRKGIKGIVKQSEETKEKHRKNNKGKGNPFYGKKHTEETRKKLKELGSSEKSIKRSLENLKFVTPESIKRGAENRKGWKQKEEIKKQISESVKRTKALIKQQKQKGQLKLF